MGAFLVKYGSMSIQPKYQEKFQEQLIRIANAGGMMHITHVQMFDKSVSFLKPFTIYTDIKNKDLLFEFNYYESNYWETAGYNDGSIWSNKVGHKQFNRCLHSMYILMETYPEVEGFIGGSIYCDNEIILDWLKNILKEPLDLKNRRKPVWIYNILKNDECEEVSCIIDLNKHLIYGCEIRDIIKHIFSEKKCDEALSFFRYTDETKKTKTVNIYGNDKFIVPPVMFIARAIDNIIMFCKGDDIDEENELKKIFLSKYLDKAVHHINETNIANPNYDNLINYLAELLNAVTLEGYIKLASNEMGWNEEELLERYKDVNIQYPNTPYNRNINDNATTAHLYAYDDTSNMALFWQDDGEFELPAHFWQDLNIVKEKFKEIQSSTSEVNISSIELIKLALDACSDLNERMKNIMLTEEGFYFLIDYDNKDTSVPLLKLLDYYSEKLSVWFEKSDGFADNLFYLKMKQIVAMVCNKHLLKYLLN